MREIGVAEARNKLGTLLDWVESGAGVVITRRGKPVAKLVRVVGSPHRADALRAVENICARSIGMTLGGLAIKDLIDEGRL